MALSIMESAMRSLDLQANSAKFIRQDGPYRLLNIDSGELDAEGFHVKGAAQIEANARNNARADRGWAWVVIEIKLAV